MEITFRKTKFAKHSQTIQAAQREWGPVRGKLIRQRLDELSAADSLEMMRFVPRARCHELTGNLAGLISVDLDHPYRLLFEPDHDPVPKKEDGGLDWTKITVIKVTEIRDTHD